MANKRSEKAQPMQMAERLAGEVAREMGLELVEVTLQKESRGKCLSVFVDKEGGLSLDDCERYHKRLQPMLDDVDYDIMEVSSPGVDRPIKTARDFEKNRGKQVEVRLFAPVDGAKSFQGALKAMDAQSVTIEDAQGAERTFERKAVAIIKPVIEWDENDFADIVLDEEADEE